jgi:hypothetical protein
VSLRHTMLEDDSRTIEDHASRVELSLSGDADAAYDDPSGRLRSF